MPFMMDVFMWFSISRTMVLLGEEGSLEEADNPPASSGRAPLPAEVRRTPGMTQLERKPQEKKKCLKTCFSCQERQRDIF